MPYKRSAENITGLRMGRGCEGWWRVCRSFESAKLWGIESGFEVRIACLGTILLKAYSLLRNRLAYID
jgi:hypothetical protein